MSHRNLSYIGRGIYPLRLASRLSGVPARRIRRWLSGYSFARPGGRHSSPPVWAPDYEPIGGKLALSFADLIEVRFVDRFIEAGVPWKSLRVAAERASALLGHARHPFATETFVTDGSTILMKIVTDVDSSELLDLVRDQVELRRIVSPFIKGELEFEGATAARWLPRSAGGLVAIDPRRSFGQPILRREGIPTRTLHDAVLVEGSARRVAELYEIPVNGVHAAVDFERQLAA